MLRSESCLVPPKVDHGPSQGMQIEELDLPYQLHPYTQSSSSIVLLRRSRQIICHTNLTAFLVVVNYNRTDAVRYSNSILHTDSFSLYTLVKVSRLLVVLYNFV